MTELKKIEYAKSFIDKLAKGINPLDGTSIPEQDIINNVRLSRCFFYVSDILRQVIENGGVQEKNEKKNKKAFYISENVLKTLHLIIEFKREIVSCQGQLWDSGKNEKLSTLFNKGIPTYEIAKEMKRTTSATRA